MRVEAFWDQVSWLREVMDAAYNGIVMIDKAGMIRLFNQAAHKCLGIKAPSLIGQHIHVVSEEAWQDFRSIIRTGLPQVGKKITIGESTIIANRTPILLSGRVIGILSVFQDISEYERISSELESFKQLNRQMDAIFESSYDGLYITDGLANTLRVNQAYERISRLKRDDLIGRNMRDLVQEGIFDRSVSLEVLRLKEPVTIMQEIVGKKVIVTGSPIVDSDGKISLVVTNVRDITELNQLREELEQTRMLSERYQAELEELQKLESALDCFVAKSEMSRDMIKKAIKVSGVDTSVLITGESGVGKSLLAKLIHQMGPRKEGPFIKISCGAIPASLMESELFGYERGAFTGARTEGKAGLLEIAHGGTVFLDEIGELPLSLQTKLLGVLEDRQISRLGGTTSRNIDMRFIAATNRDLKRMVKSGDFREDLYFRVGVVPIHIPPLRDRRDDIIPLMEHFLGAFNRRMGKTKRISTEVFDYLLKYPFSGNVRELINLVERAVILSEKDVIVLKDIPPSLEKETDAGENGSDAGLSLKDSVAEVERKIIKETLDRCGTISRAAAALKIDQSNISRKMKKYRLKKDSGSKR